MLKWYLKRDGQVDGPFTTDQMRSLHENGSFQSFDRVSLDKRAWRLFDMTEIEKAEEQSAEKQRLPPEPEPEPPPPPRRRGYALLMWGIVALVLLGLVAVALLLVRQDQLRNVQGL